MYQKILGEGRADGEEWMGWVGRRNIRLSDLRCLYFADWKGWGSLRVVDRATDEEL